MREPKKPRANYSMEFKLAMVEKYLQPGVNIALLARNNGINDNLLFKWRSRYQYLADAPVDEGTGTPVIIDDNIQCWSSEHLRCCRLFLQLRQHNQSPVKSVSSPLAAHA